MESIWGESMRIMENGIVRDMTTEEIAEFQKQSAIAEAQEKTRPLTEQEISRMFIAQNINAVITDDATASRAVEFHPVLKRNGDKISVGTRINWNGQLKRASVDLWDTDENNPDNAPSLWEDINYRNGYRVIPETITTGTAFALNECGWWGETLYKSILDNNVWTPEANASGWEVVEI